MNVELLKKVRQQIEDHPELYDTPCCIAGWAVKLSGEPCPPEETLRKAKELLELDDYTLFFVGRWPESVGFDPYIHSPHNSEIALKALDCYMSGDWK